jgi:hypothetical protein
MEQVKKSYQIEIPMKEYHNMFQIVKASDKEVAFLYEVKKSKVIKEDMEYISYRLGSFIMPKQTMKSAHVEIDAESEATHLYEMEQKGMDIDTVKCMVHSHVSMSTFYSGTDKSEFDRLWGISDTFYISMVVNNREEFFTCIADKEEGEYVKNPTLVKILPDGWIGKEEAKKMIKEAEIESGFKSYSHGEDYLFDYAHNDYYSDGTKDRFGRIAKKEETEEYYQSAFYRFYNTQNTDIRQILDEMESYMEDIEAFPYKSLYEITKMNEKEIVNYYQKILKEILDMELAND